MEKYSLHSDPFKQPNQLRGESLPGQQLSGILSEKEAKLHAHLVFPNNPRAAELLRKEILGQITEEEQEELNGYFRQKLQHEKFSPEVNALWDRVEAGDPNVLQIGMSQNGAVEVSPDDPEKIIWTYGLGGCYACLLFSEHPDGTRNAILTHYPPTEILQNLANLQELIGQNVKMKEVDTKSTVLIMAPGEWVKDPITKKFSFRALNQQAINLLTLTIQKELGHKVDIKLELYSEAQSDQKDQGTLLVYIPPSGKGQARYKTWFSRGVLGEPEQNK